jgi:hypothetical protein
MGSAMSTLDDAERRARDRLVAKPNTLLKVVWRAQIVLVAACVLSWMAVCKESGKGKKTVWRWQERCAKASRGLRAA